MKTKENYYLSMNGNSRNRADIPKSRIKLRNRLLTRLLISHILLASLPIVIAGILLTRTAKNSIEDIVSHRNLEFAKRTSESIANSLDQAQKVLKSTAENVQTFELRTITPAILINNIVKDVDIFEEIAILNDAGQIDISTHYISDRDVHMEKDFVRKLRLGGDYLSELQISDENLPFIELAQPLLFLDGSKGILHAKVNLKVMWDLIDSSAVGDQGEAFVFDKNGTFIAHSDRKKIYGKDNFDIQSILNGIAGNESGHKIYSDSDGIEMIASFAPLQTTRWGIVIQQPTTEAFRPARHMNMQIIVIVISALLIASIIAYIYTKRIVEPIDLLISGIKKYSTGNLDYRIKPRGKDEIATLMKQFNTMAIRLTAYQNRLKRIERFETLSKMAAILSHEIKNPLNAMVINMQIQRKELEKSSVNKKKLLHYQNIVTSEISRLDKLVNNFLLIAIQPELKKSEVTISRLIQEIIEAYEVEATQKNIRVIADFDTGSLTVHADENRIKQAFINIVINALQAMPNGGELKIRIYADTSVTSEGYHDLVKIEFRDTGGGIPKESLKHIFDFYYTTKKGGTGLGLAIAQQIIDEHEGRIEVESILDESTIFTVTLPLVYQTNS